MNAGPSSLATTVHQWIDRPGAGSDLTSYFAEPFHVASGSAYSGRFFVRLDGGGDRPAVCDRFTAADLVAVQMLSVNVPPEMSIAILHGELGRTLSRYLREIPTDVRLGDQQALDLVAVDGPAQKAWGLLKREPDAGYVIAGKLMARKRPHLIPVYDSVVQCALGEPKKLWQSLHAVLADDTGIRDRLTQLRSIGRVPPEVSELRVLDVAVWMEHRRHHNSDGCSVPGTSNLAN